MIFVHLEAETETYPDYFLDLFDILDLTFALENLTDRSVCLALSVVFVYQLKPRLLETRLFFYCTAILSPHKFHF